MANNARELMPSFLDRLIEAGVEGTSAKLTFNVQQMIDSIRADLEDLLNTRQGKLLTDCPYPEVKESLLSYGMPDLTSIAGVTSNTDESIGRMVEETIRRFEPRLRNVRATMVEAPLGEKNERRVQFHIEGMLNVDPAPEVGFETVFELTTGQASIKQMPG